MPKIGSPLPSGVAIAGLPSAVSDGRPVRLHFDEYGRLFVVIAQDGSTSVATTLPNNVDGVGSGTRALAVTTFPKLYNGATWDLTRSNTEAILLASAARTASLSSADQTNHNARGIIITIDVTAITDTPSITFTVQHKDSIAGQYETLFLTASAITATGVHTFIIYPGVAAAADDVVQVVGYPLGRTWRVTVTHADGDSITYSIAGSYIL